MLELKSEWRGCHDNMGNYFPAFILFLNRDGKSYNCSMMVNDTNDGDSVLLTINSMIQNLIEAAFPEMRDPLNRLKKELEELEYKAKGIKTHIEILEKARAEGKEHEMYEEHKFCKYESCKVSFMEHHHIDEHTITFLKPKDE
jgi:hypothetical protein